MYNVDCYLQCGLEQYNWAALPPLLNQNAVKAQLHVPQATVYSSPSQLVAASMNSDVSKSVINLFPELLSNYRVLIYQGLLDYIVNPVGADEWLAKVNWGGITAFNNLHKRLWFSKATGKIEVIGYVKQSSNLTQILLPNTGHFATLDQPLVASEMMRLWISNSRFPTVGRDGSQ
jgi:carboxypeptidase C (cathepsin A)